MLLIVAFEGKLSHEAVERACASEAVLAEGFDADLLVFLKSISHIYVILVKQFLRIFGWDGCLLLNACRCDLPSLHRLAFGQVIADGTRHGVHSLVIESIRRVCSASQSLSLI